MLARLFGQSLVAAMVIVGSACEREPTTFSVAEPGAKDEQRAELVPTFRVVEIGSTTQTITLTPQDNNTIVGPVGIGTYARTTLLRVVASA